MRRRATRFLGLLAVPVYLWLAACGGSSSSSGGTTTRGTVQGTLGRQAAGATVRLEGTGLQTTAGPNGEFSLSEVPQGEYTLGVTGTAGTGAAAMIRVSPGQTTTVPAIDLTAAGQITGLITDTAHRPVAGAKVTARLVPLVYAYAANASTAVLDGVGAGGPTPLAARQTTSTDRPPLRLETSAADGSFRFAAVDPGPYSVEVTADGYESGATGTFVSAGQTGTADVQLVAIDPSNATVSGTVQGTQNGQTVALAYVRVDLWPTGGVALPMSSVMSSGSGGGSAGGSTGSVPPSISAPNDDPWYLPPFINAKSAFTDSNGQFVVRNVQPGTYTLTYSLFGYQTVSRTITVTSRQQDTENATLAYNLATISGTISGQTNGGTQPLAGVWVTAYGYVIEPGDGGVVGYGGAGIGTATGGTTTVSSGNSGSSTSPSPAIAPPGMAQTDANGHYSLQVAAGQVQVTAWAEGFDTAFQPLTVTTAGATGVNLTLTPYTGPVGPFIGLRRQRAR